MNVFENFEDYEKTVEKFSLNIDEMIYKLNFLKDFKISRTKIGKDLKINIENNQKALELGIGKDYFFMQDSDSKMLYKIKQEFQDESGEIINYKIIEKFGNDEMVFNLEYLKMEDDFEIDILENQASYRKNGKERCLKINWYQNLEDECEDKMYEELEDLDEESENQGIEEEICLEVWDNGILKILGEKQEDDIIHMYDLVNINIVQDFDNRIQEFKEVYKGINKYLDKKLNLREERE